MLVITTTVYFTEAECRIEGEICKSEWQEAADLKESTRQWVSIYEGKNRVLPLDID